MSEKFVTMIKDGVKMHGVHPDAVAGHKAIGWELLPEVELAAQKPVKPESKAADNDTAKKPAGRGRNK